MGDVISLDARRRSRDAAHGAAERVRATFYFDLADPGTYLAAERVELQLPGADWVPASLDVLRLEVGAASATSPADWAALSDRAAALGMPLVWPDEHPAPRPAAMRAAAHACRQGHGAAFVLAASRLAFCGGFDLDDPEVLAEASAAAALGLEECLHAARDASLDAEMHAAARTLAAAGADRLPAVRIGPMLFCGEDRIGTAAMARRDVPPRRRRLRAPLR